MGYEKLLGDELLALDGLSKDAAKAMVERVRASIRADVRRVKIYRIILVFSWVVFAGIWIKAIWFDKGPYEGGIANLPRMTALAVAGVIVILLTISYGVRSRRLMVRLLEGRLFEIEQQLLELRRGQSHDESKR